MNYEEYMRNVLGYSACGCGNPYNNLYDSSYDVTDYNFNYPNNNQMQRQERKAALNNFYPDIYKLLHPMVCKVCNKNATKEMSNTLLEEMTNEIYSSFESDDRFDINQRTVLKNGDVRNPNAKEPEQTNDTRQLNYLLKDLIKILLLDNFATNMQFQPQIPPPQYYVYTPQINNNPMMPPPNPQMQNRQIQYNSRNQINSNQYNNNSRPRSF